VDVFPPVGRGRRGWAGGSSAGTSALKSSRSRRQFIIGFGAVVDLLGEVIP
jgi:hypothetical protein